MFVVEMGSCYGGDEELGSVGVGAGVGHGQEEWFLMFRGERFIFEFFTVDRLSASPVSGGEITALDHKPIQMDIREDII